MDVRVVEVRIDITRRQSGKSGTAEDWERSRSHVADAIDRDGSFLDVGCANGYLLECLDRWTSFEIEPYGLEISPDLAALAPVGLHGHAGVPYTC